MERKVQAAGETSIKQSMLPGRVPGQADSACSKVQRRAGVHQWAEEWQVHHLRGPQENFSHQKYCGMNMELSKWSIFSLPEGIEQYLWGGGLCTAVQPSCGNSHQIRWVKDLDSLMLVLRSQWIFLEIFPWNPVSASFFQDEKGRPKAQMELWGRFSSVVSTERGTVGREVLNMLLSFFLSDLVACAETHPLQKLRIWCLRVFSIIHFCRSGLFNICKQNLSADMDTPISIKKLEKILHPMKRRRPVMQHVWDLHQVWFIRAYGSSHRFFQD